MSEVEIKFRDGSDTTVEDVEFADVLCNINKVAIDGTTYHEVDQVTYNE